MEILTILIWAAFSFACYKIAESQGRNAWLGAFLGLLFGIFAVVGYLIAGNKS